MIRQSLKIFALLAFALCFSVSTQAQTLPEQNSISDATKESVLGKMC